MPARPITATKTLFVIDDDPEIVALLPVWQRFLKLIGDLFRARPAVNEDMLAGGGGDEDGMESHVSNPTTRLIMNCGHWTQQEQPDEVNRMIADAAEQKRGKLHAAPAGALFSAFWCGKAINGEALYSILPQGNLYPDLPVGLNHFV